MNRMMMAFAVGMGLLSSSKTSQSRSIISNRGNRSKRSKGILTVPLMKGFCVCTFAFDENLGIERNIFL